MPRSSVLVENITIDTVLLMPSINGSNGPFVDHDVPERKTSEHNLLDCATAY
jgi:hypothetical protein